jgi:hypothetical protein
MSWGKLREARIALQKSLFVEESPSVRRYLNEVEQRLTFEKNNAKVSNCQHVQKNAAYCFCTLSDSISNVCYWMCFASDKLIAYRFMLEAVCIKINIVYDISAMIHHCCQYYYYSRQRRHRLNLTLVSKHACTALCTLCCTTSTRM